VPVVGLTGPVHVIELAFGPLALQVQVDSSFVATDEGEHTTPLTWLTVITISRATPPGSTWKVMLPVCGPSPWQLIVTVSVYVTSTVSWTEIRPSAPKLPLTGGWPGAVKRKVPPEHPAGS
jgi:hypothetical protein